VQLTGLRDELRRLAASVPGDEEVPTLLFGIATRLSAMRFQLRGIVASLGETDAEEAEDEASQLRSAIECVLVDLLEPAIANLEQAAEARRPAAEI